MSERLVQITRYKRDEYYDMIRDLDRRKRESIFEPQLPIERLSKYVADSVTQSAKQPVPDCLTCGVCCAYFLIVPIQRQYAEKLSEYCEVVADEADDIVIERVLARSENDPRCKHLEGELRKSISCGIYEDRPETCRLFEVGSDKCHELRRMYGVEPQLSSEEVEEEIGKVIVLPTGLISFTVIEVDSVRHEMFTTEEGNVESAKRYMMRVIVVLDDEDETIHLIHRYDPSIETWYEHEFLGKTLDEAMKMVGQEQGVNE